MQIFFFFFFNDTATTEIYTLSLHDALPIYHVVHGQPFDRIEGRHGSLKTFTHGQRGPRVACPVHRLGEDRVSVIPWLDEHIDGFARTESELIDRSEEHTSELQSHSDLVCRL